MKYTVLLSAPYMLPFLDRFVPILNHFGIDVLTPEVHERLTEPEILSFAGKFDGTICGDDHYNEHVISACLPRLRIISKWGTGIDSINKPFAESVGVKVGNTPNAFTLPVSDSVMGYILVFARRLTWMDSAIKNGEWNKIPGRSLSECTLGVVGIGNVGKAVIRRAKGFGMKLLGNDIRSIEPDFIVEQNLKMINLDQLLAKSDFVSLNCDLNPSSRHLMNENAFSKMQSHAVLINTARGPIVKEDALITALQNKTIGGAALDVFENEPLPLSSPLLKMENVMLAPHNSNSSPQAWERVHKNTIKNLLDGLNINHSELDELFDASRFEVKNG